jgi:hypothetical protein
VYALTRSAVLFAIALLTAAPAAGARIALVPLDDRPVSLQDPVMLGAIAGAQVVTPPRGMLGRYLRTGDGDSVARWLDGLDVTTLDGVVIATDMLAYGGLIGSRVPRVFEADARRRLEAIARLKARRANLPIYAFSTIMRLAPTSDGGNEPWREKVARWAEISPAAGRDAAVTAEVAEIESSLPAGMINRYRAARARNLAVNLSLVDMAGKGAIDFLVFGQDDAKPAGVHLADREAIGRAIAAANLEARTAIQSGADELASLLVTRAMLTKAGFQPRVLVTYSSTAARGAVMPFEDRLLTDTVEAQIATAGALVAPGPGTVPLRLFVYASRHETPDLSDAFAADIAKAMASGARVAVADIDTKGDIQGSALPFTEALRTRKLLPRLAGYASWNTAGNTVGLALSQGLLFALGVERVATQGPDQAREVASAQIRALVRRLANDFLYQGVVRGQSIEDFVKPRGLNPARLDDSGKARVEKYLAGELRPLVDGVLADFGAEAWRLPATTGRRPAAALLVKDLERFEVTLPWSRMFEAELVIEVRLVPAGSEPRPPRPRILH